jgi:hypothetical protein
MVDRQTLRSTPLPSETLDVLQRLMLADTSDIHPHSMPQPKPSS